MQNDKQDIYITAIIPAHDEAQGISKAIKSIYSHVNKIIVACDNCTDDTASISRQYGADIVFNTVNNVHRKSGALNQALENYVNWTIKNQYLLIMDADTKVVNPQRWFTKAKSLIYPNRSPLSQYAKKLSKIGRANLKFFHKSTYNKLFSNKAYDCVGSLFQAPNHLKHYNNIEEGQRLEWEGYMSKIERDRKVFVLTGTCSLISAKKIQDVNKLNHFRYYYNNNSITEDFEMTIKLKECNARMISPVDCQCITSVKSHIRDLINQRRRWYLGALQLVSNHKINHVTGPYILQQLMLLISVIAFMLFLLVSGYTYLIGSVNFTVFWTIIFLIFDINQTIRIWKFGNILDRLYSISMIGCLYYSFLLQIAYISAFYSWINNEDIYWNHKNKKGD